MTNNSEKEIKYEFKRGAVPNFTLTMFPYQYFSCAKPKLIEREKGFFYLLLVSTEEVDRSFILLKIVALLSSLK